MDKDSDNIWSNYITEAVVPFEKRREIRKGMAKKHGRKILKPYTFGFDIEFKVPLDEGSIRSSLEHYEFNVHPVNEDYKDWVMSEKLSHLSEPEYEYVEDWESDHEEPDLDDYIEDLDEDHEDYDEDYEAAHNSWEEAANTWAKEKFRIEEEIENWDNEVEYAIENSLDDYITHLIDSGEWSDIVNVESGEIDYEIDEMRGEINDALQDHIPEEEFDDYDEEFLMGWDVSEDEARNYEITSPILTTKDFPMISDVLLVIGNYGESGNDTSAHIHIGIPDTFDYFDLMVLYDLVDEEYMKKIQPNRKRKYAGLKDVYFRKLGSVLRHKHKDGDVIDVEDLHEIGVEKHMGINISNVSGKITKDIKQGKKVSTGVGTSIEFRYLSSEIFDGYNGIEEFFEMIDYFMMLLKIAEKRNSFKFKDHYGGKEETFILTRESKNEVRFNLDKARMPYDKPEDIKQRFRKKSPSEEYIKLVDKIYDKIYEKNILKEYPKPNFKNMNKKSILEWWLQTPEIAFEYLRGLKSIDERLKVEYDNPFVQRVLDDWKVAGGLVHRNQMGDIGLKRLPKLEHQLMYTKWEKNSLKEAVYHIIVGIYIRHLYQTSVDGVDYEEVHKFDNYKGSSTEDNEILQTQFKKFIHKLNTINN
jgi:hypothetical protein